MKRRGFLLGMVSAIVLPSSASAQSVQDQIIAQLRSQGYSRISISRTLLGRTRIVATGDGQRREIVFNPRTGEVLRDYWRAQSDEAGGSSGKSGSSGSSGQGRQGDDDDHDDDNDDHQYDDDDHDDDEDDDRDDDRDDDNDRDDDDDDDD